MSIASVNWRAAIAVVAVAWLGGWSDGLAVSSAQEAPSAQQIWTVPEIGSLPNNANGRLVRLATSAESSMSTPTQLT